MLLALSVAGVAGILSDQAIVAGFFLSLALGLIPGLVARSKGEPWGEWYFMGVILLPIALLILVPGERRETA